MGHDHHVVGFDQARLSNRYDGPLLTGTPQYFFVTDFVRPSYVKKPFSKATSHSSPAFARPHSAPFGKVPQMTVFTILFFRQRLAR